MDYLQEIQELMEGGTPLYMIEEVFSLSSYELDAIIEEIDHTIE